MESISELSTSTLSSISLMILKSILSILITYPYNVVIIGLVCIVVIVQFIRGIFGSGNVKRDIKRMKGEIDEGKIKSGVDELKKDINEVSKEIEKLGLMFGGQTQSKIINHNNSSRDSCEICEFVVK